MAAFPGKSPINITHLANALGQIDLGLARRYCGNVRNITVSLEDEIYRRARVAAAERGTSVSALVRGYLEELGSAESEAERLRRTERALRQQVVGFRAADRLARDDLHSRRDA